MPSHRVPVVQAEVERLLRSVRWLRWIEMRAARIEAAALAVIAWVDGPQPRREGEHLTRALRDALALPVREDTP